MPVTDINFVEMGEQATQSFVSAEAVTEFWADNPEIVAWVFIIVVLLIMLSAGFFLLRLFWPAIKRMVI